MARGIRWATRRPGEAPTVFNHAGIMDNPVDITEALVRVVTHPFADVLEDLEVWRHRRLTITQRQAIAIKAREYRGRPYGALKILGAHLPDALINKALRPKKEVFLFRRMACLDALPICVWIVTMPYDRAARIRFGTDPRFADPDHLHDHVLTSPVWEKVWERKHEGEAAA
jgi:hypothetical protein